MLTIENASGESTGGSSSSSSRKKADYYAQSGMMQLALNTRTKGNIQDLADTKKECSALLSVAEWWPF